MKAVREVKVQRDPRTVRLMGILNGQGLLYRIVLGQIQVQDVDGQTWRPSVSQNIGTGERELLELALRPYQETKEEIVTLTMTVEEAALLKFLCTRVGGSPVDTQRKTTGEWLTELNRVKVPNRMYETEDRNRAIYFKN